MEIIEFQDGKIKTPAKVTINEVEYEVSPAEWEGTTPMSAYNINRMQKNLLTSKYHLDITDAVTAGSAITLPCQYKVGQDVLDVYLNGEKLIKATSSDDEGHYYEVGDADSISNQIKITSDWSLESGDYFDFVVRGEWSE